MDYMDDQQNNYQLIWMINKQIIKPEIISFKTTPLFQSFMIMSTRDDEKRIIKQLMQSTEMTLGDEWYVRYCDLIMYIYIYIIIYRFVINKEWWDKWCSYTGYNPVDDGKHNND
eukprot:225823_1